MNSSEIWLWILFLGMHIYFGINIACYCKNSKNKKKSQNTIYAMHDRYGTCDRTYSLREEYVNCNTL